MPVHLLSGDPYRVKVALQNMTATLDPAWVSFNYQETTDVGVALSEARTMPFGAVRRVTVCTTTLFSKKDEATLTLLQSGVEALPDASDLVFVAEKVDARLAATKWLKKLGTIVHFPVLDAWDVEGTKRLVSDVALSLNLRLTPDVVEALATAVGPDGFRLESELTKLATQDTITLDNVLACVSNQTQTSLDLAQAMVAGDKAEALGLLVALRRVPDLHPLQVLSTLIGRFEKLFIVAHAKGTNEEVAKLAGVANPKQIYYLKRDAQSMGDRLVKILPLLLEAEVAIKSGLSAEIELERLVIQS